MALVERLQDTTQVGYWCGEIPLEYIYTYGRAGEAFYRTLIEKEKILGAYCPQCDAVFVPASIFCERCFERIEENYRELDPVGTVETFTVLYKNLDGTLKERPEVIAMVRIKGAVGGLLHYLREADPKDVNIGMEVKAVFKPKDQREGGLKDISHFKPL
jgi:uncharacterized OB-fold protein